MKKQPRFSPWAPRSAKSRGVLAPSFSPPLPSSSPIETDQILPFCSATKRWSLSFGAKVAVTGVPNPLATVWRPIVTSPRWISGGIGSGIRGPSATAGEVAKVAAINAERLRKGRHLSRFMGTPSGGTGKPRRGNRTVHRGTVQHERRRPARARRDRRRFMGAAQLFDGPLLPPRTAFFRGDGGDGCGQLAGPHVSPFKVGASAGTFGADADSLRRPRRPGRSGGANCSTPRRWNLPICPA